MARGPSGEGGPDPRRPCSRRPGRRGRGRAAREPHGGAASAGRPAHGAVGLDAHSWSLLPWLPPRARPGVEEARLRRRLSSLPYNRGGGEQDHGKEEQGRPASRPGGGSELGCGGSARNRAQPPLPLPLRRPSPRGSDLELPPPFATRGSDPAPPLAARALVRRRKNVGRVSSSPAERDAAGLALLRPVTDGGVEAEELQEAPAPRAPAWRGLARVGSEVPH
ncbi:hypothetical protein PVAP13_6KG016100 [Panicum virgatum]|uniref:Uncharacterized protein n=1 Tax=Panicum virgatum TaxID=38727 RepID=A0A8T0R791_PANVG|nr:hypothetical protein PVAP13_6KG016100 [Panicum virgatum]